MQMIIVSGKYELTNNIQRTKMVGINCNLSAQVLVTSYITFALYNLLFLTYQPERVISLLTKLLGGKDNPPPSVIHIPPTALDKHPVPLLA